ncbi:MAG: hypothetical protein EZS28_033292 [Streblomastix strix]|uniref:Uncharacterized protein n=1 Tax=Streblomastix strix TaxID=222440 RepID=A0A5J4UM98_9EUKA|nr:MAG: hypothetical protein EZS28_033292 [Streblomastix strix]
MGDQAYSAEDLLVWVYETNWIETDQVVPDQVTPAFDAIPQLSIVNGSAGVSTEYSRGDHQNPLQVSTIFPAKDTANGEEGVANTYASSDHTHHVNLSSSVPLKDTGTGTAGTDNVYASVTHQYPLNVDQSSVNIPLLNATAAANGTSDYNCGNEHVHPQQLSYDGNLTATKFFKTGGTSNDIFLANGETKKVVLASKTYQVIEQPQYIKLCTLIALNFSTDNSIEFQIDSRSGFGKLQFNQHWSNGTGIDKYQYQFIPSLATGFSNAWIIYFDTGINRYGELWCLIDSYSYNTYIYQTSISVFQGIITDILTTVPQSKLPTDYSCINQLFANMYGNLQLNPVQSGQQGYDDGLRVARTIESTGSTSINLGCSRTLNNGVVQGQWIKYSPSINVMQATQSFKIAASNQAADDVTRGLQIQVDANTLKFNNHILVDDAPNQTITGIKTFYKIIQVNPSISGTFKEGIRLSKHTTNQWSNIKFGCDPNSNSGYNINQWLIRTEGNNGQNQYRFTIVKAGQEGDNNRGLQISADGNTLTFNGSVIAGTGATNGATNGSVNYSAGNRILWGQNSIDTIDGFYIDGAKVYQRGHPITMGSVSL